MEKFNKININIKCIQCQEKSMHSDKKSDLITSPPINHLKLN